MSARAGSWPSSSPPPRSWECRRAGAGTDGTLIDEPTVVIDGDTIVAIDSTATPPEHARVVDLPGTTLLPGLVDTHVHVAFDASSDVVGARAGRDDDAALAAMTVAARTAVRSGITTVRDLGDREYLSLALRGKAESDPSLPTIVAAGPPITTPGGHCHYLGGSTTGTAGVRVAVREHAERGVDVVKIMASGGNLTPGSRPELPQFGPDELRAAVEEAHRHGLPITAHAHGTQAIADAVEAGLDRLEHVTFMGADGIDPVPADLLAAIVARRVTLGLTVGVAPVAGAVPHPAMARRMPALMANLRVLCESGAPITAGTDGGVSPAKPHDVLPRAIGHLVRVGMSPLDVLRATTSRAAAVCGLGHRKGRLAARYDADLLAVQGNPLSDPAALHRIRAV